MADKKDIPFAMLEILREYTDEDHFISTPDLIDLIREMYGLELERRTIYANADLLRKYGYRIDDWHKNGIGNNLAEHQFSVKEISKLYDLVQNSNQYSQTEKKRLQKKVSVNLTSLSRSSRFLTNRPTDTIAASTSTSKNIENFILFLPLYFGIRTAVLPGQRIFHSVLIFLPGPLSPFCSKSR